MMREDKFSCTRNGLTIRGTEYRPEGENLPVAIVCHGIMANQDTVRQYTKELAQVGYDAFCFDFCGGTMTNCSSDGLTTEMSVLTEVKDLEAVMEYTHSLPHTGNRLLLMGCSQGGFVAALTAAKHPDLVDRLVLFYPALCIPDNAREGKLLYAEYDPADIPEQMPCGPMMLGRCFPADVMDMDAFEEIKSFEGPVLIVHGTEDDIVKPDYSKRAVETYAHAKLCLIEGGAHGFGRKYDKVATDALREFAICTESY